MLMGGDLGDLFPPPPPAPGDPVPLEPRLSLPDDKDRKLANEEKLRDGGTTLAPTPPIPEEEEEECEAPETCGGDVPIAAAAADEWEFVA